VSNQWIDGYNTIRPHPGLGYKCVSSVTPPLQFATTADAS
jgi:hypothetical protein